MTGLKQRILGRRSASPSDPEGPSPTDPQTAPAGASAEAQPPSLFGSSEAPAGLTPDDVPTIAHTTASGAVTPPETPAAPQEPAAATGAPAGVDPEEPARPGFRERGRMRRRLRYLRRAHELGLRDLGGLVFDLRRFRRQRFDLVEAKLQTLTLVDREMRALETTLGDRRPIIELREAGIASCPRCGGLTASDANFCANCGLQIGDAPPVVTAPTPPTAPVVAPAPAAPAAPAPGTPAAPAVSAAAAGSTPLSTGAAPANGAPGGDSSVTSGDPLAPPPAGR
ncbi:MAG: zinc ribbon domain-containing protein [Solirubrobacteraceae bacterium]|nr:zinc ribbon domain-containing protein [Solirubrobacteraceae bacterium]